MTHEIKIEELAAKLREQRGTRGLREIAKEIGDVSASTLSRIEKGNIPDLDTFVRICRWLGVSSEAFIIGEDGVEIAEEVQPENYRQTITAHLKADRTLDPKTAEALARMIDLAYQQAERGDIKPS